MLKDVQHLIYNREHIKITEMFNNREFQNVTQLSFKKQLFQGLPGDPIVKNPPTNAGTRERSVREDPHPLEQLSLCATLLSPHCRACDPHPATSEVFLPQSPFSATRDATAMRSPRNAMKILSPTHCNQRKAHAQEGRHREAKVNNKQKNFLK